MRVGTAIAMGYLVALASGCAGEGLESETGNLAPVEISAALDRSEATLGDRVHLEVSTSWDPGVEVSVEEPELGVDGLALVDTIRNDPEARDGRMHQVRSYRLRADRVGTYPLPAVRVTYSIASEVGASASDLQGERFVESEALDLEVLSVLPVETEVTDIRDIKALRPVAEGSRWRPWVIGAAILAALSLALWLWRRRRSEPVVPPLPAHVVALQELKRLENPDLGSLEALRLYYFEISGVLRQYVERRYSLNATDLTTEEIVARIGSLDLEIEQGGVLRRFLVDADLVKFAARVPAAEDIRRTWDRAVRFVESTKPADPELEAAG